MSIVRTSLSVAAAVVAAAFVVVLLGVVSAGDAQADHVSPVVVEGNPTCVGLGYQFGFKPQPEPPPSGTYTVPGTSETITIVSDGTIFSWTSTVGIDAVIVKGGPRANVYRYDPPAEAFADTGLRPPINDGGQQAAISHLEFCIDWEVTVTKTATTRSVREWTWTIEKTADTAGPLVLTPGQQYPVEYWVEVDATSTDSGWGVSGTITVHNNTPLPATVTSVSDMVSGGIAAGVVCPQPLPAALAAGAMLVCTYDTALPDGSNRVNTATATTTGAVGGGSGTANVVFGAPTTEIDEQIEVDDDLHGLLGTVAAADAPKTFQYTRTVGPYSDRECGDHKVTNTATFTTNDTGTEDSSSWTVDVFVDCPHTGGCTLTQGYWKTHSERGPAPYDDTWALLPNGADTQLVGSGESYHQVFWTPVRGNAWYQLAHQYMAAELNALNGADVPPSIAADMAAAKALLDKYDAAGPGTPGANLVPRGADRTAAVALAGNLAAYNEGITGPGHCTE